MKRRRSPLRIERCTGMQLLAISKVATTRVATKSRAAGATGAYSGACDGSAARRMTLGLHREVPLAGGRRRSRGGDRHGVRNRQGRCKGRRMTALAGATAVVLILSARAIGGR